MSAPSASVTCLEKDLCALRTAVAFIDCTLEDINRDYADLEEEHLKLASYHSLLSEQSRIMDEIDHAAQQAPYEPAQLCGAVEDLDRVAMEAVTAALGPDESDVDAARPSGVASPTAPLQ